jgi:anaerobic magnesium-protoporphyrin IX monomethyl ester cyclase
MIIRDLLLLFPGITEARHFPYLSVPQITSYLRERGYSVEQRDLNIEFTIREAGR